jgi:hypothetical protein
MRLSIKIIVGAAIVAASVAAATFSAPAGASELLRVSKLETPTDHSARKKQRSTPLRVSRLSRRAADPPNPNRPYYRPVPHFYPFGQDRGFF